MYAFGCYMKFNVWFTLIIEFARNLSLLLQTHLYHECSFHPYLFVTYINDIR